MNTEHLNQNIDPAANQDAGEKTFTQDDVNRIVQDRLAKDREKASKELGEREQELAQREFRLNSRQKLCLHVSVEYIFYIIIPAVSPIIYNAPVFSV